MQRAQGKSWPCRGRGQGHGYHQAHSGVVGFGQVATNSAWERCVGGGVYVCGGGRGEASIRPTVCSGTMSSDTSPKFHFQVGLVHSEQENSGMVPQSPGKQPLHPLSPTKNTMQVTVLCGMNRTEGREPRRPRDVMLYLGTDHWAAGKRTTQPGGDWAEAAIEVLGFSVAKGADSASEKQDWVNIRLPLPVGDLQGGLRPRPWRSPTFWRSRARRRLTWVHP